MIARSIGAAPRQRGSSDGWTLKARVREQRLLDPSRRTRRRRRRRRREVELVDVARLGEPQPRSKPDWARAARRAGGPGPAGRSGRVTTRWRRRRGDHPHRELRGAQVGEAQAPSSASRSERIASLRWSRGGPVEDQHPVEVVDLVLDHPRLEARGLELLAHERGVVGDHREQVVEVVRDAAGELADRLEPLGLAQPRLQPRVVRDVGGDAADAVELAVLIVDQRELQRQEGPRLLAVADLLLELDRLGARTSRAGRRRASARRCRAAGPRGRAGRRARRRAGRAGARRRG